VFDLFNITSTLKTVLMFGVSELIVNLPITNTEVMNIIHFGFNMTTMSLSLQKKYENINVLIRKSKKHNTYGV